MTHLLIIQPPAHCLRTAGENYLRRHNPVVLPRRKKKNRSEIDDINLGLEHFYGDFNVVHTQLISSGVSLHPIILDLI